MRRKGCRSMNVLQSFFPSGVCCPSSEKSLIQLLIAGRCSAARPDITELCRWQLWMTSHHPNAVLVLYLLRLLLSLTQVVVSISIQCLNICFAWRLRHSELSRLFSSKYIFSDLSHKNDFLIFSFFDRKSG